MNTFFESIANHSMTTLIGMVLVHFLWQATLVAIAFGAVWKLQRRCSSQTRYLTSLMGLLIMVAFPLMTFVILSRNLEPSEFVVSNLLALDSEFSRQINGDFPTLTTDAATGISGDSGGGPAIESPAAGVSVSRIDPALLSSQRLKAMLPWLVALWSGGVVILAVRLMLGFNRVRSWRRSATAISSLKLIEMRDQLCKRMGLKKPIRLLKSIHSNSPIVIGWIRPAVLIPASIISGLTPREMEAILVHEFAHIHRHDYLVNLAQAIVETVFFYHPAVWCLSNRVREERENCCDDIAIEIGGDRKTFVHALAKLEEIRCRDFQVAVAASGGSLVNRMKRILDRQPPRGQSVWPAGIIAFALVVCLVGTLLALSGSSVASSNSNQSEADALVPIALNEDVLAISGGTNGNTEATMDEQQEAQEGEIKKAGQQRAQRSGVTVLSSLTYDVIRRKSKLWVEMEAGQPMPFVDGIYHLRVAVDEGVAHDGKIVYLTFFGQVVAADAKSGKGKWLIPWDKTTPSWKTVSVVKLERNNITQTAVELFAPQVRNSEPVYRYHDFETGELIEFAAPENETQGWGPAPELGNLRLRLTLNESELKEGQPVLAKLEIKNFGDNVESYDPQDFDSLHALQVKHVSGEPGQYLASSAGTAGGPTPLQPGQSRVLWENFDIGSLYMLDQGEFRIQAITPISRRANTIPKKNVRMLRRARTMPTSNVESLSVSEGQQTPIKRFLKSLILVAPDGWKVSYNSYGISVSLSPTGVRRDITQISMRFTPEPIPADHDLYRSSSQDAIPVVDIADLEVAGIFEALGGGAGEKQNLVRLGMTELGHLSLSSNAKAAELWPNHIAKIREACNSIK